MRNPPFSFLVFLTNENVARLYACYTAYFIALRLIASGGKLELIVLVSEQHWRVVLPARVELIHLFHDVIRAFFLYLRCSSSSCQTLFGNFIIRY